MYALKAPVVIGDQLAPVPVPADQAPPPPTRVTEADRDRFRPKLPPWDSMHTGLEGILAKRSWWAANEARMGTAVHVMGPESVWA